MWRLLVVPLAFVLAAGGCSELPEPRADMLMADYNWQPPPPEKLQCRRGPYIKVMVEPVAFVQDSGGYLGCAVPETMAPRDNGSEVQGSEVLVSLHASAEDLTLTSASSRPVFYYIVARSAADSLAWTPCVDADRCAHVQSGAPVRIPYGSIPGWVKGEPQVVLYAWRVRRGDQGAYRPDRVRAVVVDIQSPNPTLPRR